MNNEKPSRETKEPKGIQKDSKQCHFVEDDSDDSIESCSEEIRNFMREKAREWNEQHNRKQKRQQKPKRPRGGNPNVVYVGNDSTDSGALDGANWNGRGGANGRRTKKMEERSDLSRKENGFEFNFGERSHAAKKTVSRSLSDEISNCPEFDEEIIRRPRKTKGKEKRKSTKKESKPKEKTKDKIVGESSKIPKGLRPSGRTKKSKGNPEKEKNQADWCNGLNKEPKISDFLKNYMKKKEEKKEELPKGNELKKEELPKGNELEKEELPKGNELEKEEVAKRDGFKEDKIVLEEKRASPEYDKVSSETNKRKLETNSSISSWFLKKTSSEEEDSFFNSPKRNEESQKMSQKDPSQEAKPRPNQHKGGLVSKRSEELLSQRNPESIIEEMPSRKWKVKPNQVQEKGKSMVFELYTGSSKERNDSQFQAGHQRNKPSQISNDSRPSVFQEEFQAKKQLLNKENFFLSQESRNNCSSSSFTGHKRQFGALEISQNSHGFSHIEGSLHHLEEAKKYGKNKKDASMKASQISFFESQNKMSSEAEKEEEDLCDSVYYFPGKNVFGNSIQDLSLSYICLNKNTNRNKESSRDSRNLSQEPENTQNGFGAFPAKSKGSDGRMDIEKEGGMSLEPIRKAVEIKKEGTKMLEEKGKNGFGPEDFKSKLLESSSSSSSQISNSSHFSNSSQGSSYFESPLKKENIKKVHLNEPQRKSSQQMNLNPSQQMELEGSQRHHLISPPQEMKLETPQVLKPLDFSKIRSESYKFPRFSEMSSGGPFGKDAPLSSFSQGKAIFILDGDVYRDYRRVPSVESSASVDIKPSVDLKEIRDQIYDQKPLSFTNLYEKCQARSDELFMRELQLSYERGWSRRKIDEAWDIGIFEIGKRDPVGDILYIGVAFPKCFRKEILSFPVVPEGKKHPVLDPHLFSIFQMLERGILKQKKAVLTPEELSNYEYRKYKLKLKTIGPPGPMKIEEILIRFIENNYPVRKVDVFMEEKTAECEKYLSNLEHFAGIEFNFVKKSSEKRPLVIHLCHLYALKLRDDYLANLKLKGDGSLLTKRTSIDFENDWKNSEPRKRFMDDNFDPVFQYPKLVKSGSKLAREIFKEKKQKGEVVNADWDDENEKKGKRGRKSLLIESSGKNKRIDEALRLRNRKGVFMGHLGVSKNLKNNSTFNY